jgi:cytohesin
MIGQMGEIRQDVKGVCKALSVCLTAAGLVYLGCTSSATARTDSTRPTALDVGQINKAATAAESLFLDGAGRIHAVETFQRLVCIKGPSGQEELVRKEVQRMLTEAGAVVVPAKSSNPEAPLNLVMEVPEAGDLVGRPSILLNAHLDTITRSTPEFLAFDGSTGDFYHLHETEPGKSSSFGGDDRSAVAVIVETVRLLQANYWSRGVPHRRILLVFTAEEERGGVGASYLSKDEPDLFTDLDISLCIDGPLDLNSDYPRDSFVAVVSESDSTIAPYKHVLELMQEFCGRTGARFGKTETGLGRGDMAHFPSSARAGLHLRSVVRGSHSRERVNVQDLVNQIDLLCYLLLDWDHSLPLQEAAARGDTGLVKSLIEKGAEVDEREDIFFRTALHRAAAAGNTEVAELLLSYSANPNARDSTGLSALHYAAINDNKEMVELLIAKGADVDAKDASGNTPLHNAVENDHRDVAEMLSGKGAELSIHVAAFLGNIEDIEDFAETGARIDIKDGRGLTPLHYAVTAGQYDVVKFLITKGTDVNVKEIWPFGTPVHLAVENGDKEIVELLAAAGADVSARKSRATRAAPLHLAAKRGRNDIVAVLASYNADLNVKDKDGLSPLHIAVSAAHKDVVEFLLAEGADLDAEDREGNTPLNYAIWNRNRDMVKLMLEKGAGTNVKATSSGYTSLHLAIIMWSSELAELIVAAGTDVNARSNTGETPLDVVAAFGGPPATGELLVAKGAEVSSLHAAAYVGDLAKVKAFIDEGIDVNSKNPWTRGTTLHSAATAGRKEIVEFLIGCGADVDVTDRRGRTALDLAQKAEHTEIVELLRKHGAKE